MAQIKDLRDFLAAARGNGDFRNSLNRSGETELMPLYRIETPRLRKKRSVPPFKDVPQASNEGSDASERPVISIAARGVW